MQLIRTSTILPLASTVLLCSALDGLATLQLMHRGYSEANPFMQPLVALGPAAFLTGKLLLTGVCLEPLWALRDRTFFHTDWMHVGHVLLGLIATYGVLLVYELCLLFI